MFFPGLKHFKTILLRANLHQNGTNYRQPAPAESHSLLKEMLGVECRQQFERSDIYLFKNRILKAKDMIS
jgi:hypothetical protein